MKRARLYLAAFCIVMLSASVTYAQLIEGFDSGSDGSDGPLDVTVDTTLDLPPDGVFNFTTVNVASNTTLKFNRNVLNTPVFMLATGDIVVDGTIDVSGESGTSVAGGRGGPGGFDGGIPGLVGAPPSDGQGPGAGVAPAGSASYGTGGRSYGSPLLVPLVGGSGGGARGDPAPYGSGGGGAILLASNTQVIVNSSASVLSHGGRIPIGTGTGGGGSGGAIRIVSPIVTGAGTLNVNAEGPSSQGRGGAGRIRIDVLLRTQMTLRLSPSTVGSLGAFMVALLDERPRLDITHVAGGDIPEGTTGPVSILLPIDSPANQPVTVQARGFTGVVPIRVVLTPDQGSSFGVDAEIDMGAGDPATVTLNLDFPINVAVRVHAWTRDPEPTPQ